jgi:glucosamine-6-phosphate deaminase
MRIYIADNYSQMSRKAANIISAQVIMKPNATLGLATGSTPIGAYKQLVEWFKKDDIDFKDTKAINLDEYKGLKPSNKQSYAYFMNSHLFDHININKNNCYIPSGIAKNDQKECRRYDKIIQNIGPIDLQILGIGKNGHIGFNEPGEKIDSLTHVVDLEKSTVNANKRFFNSETEVPKQAFTMGMKGIMQASKILLIASGTAKSEAIYKTFCGPITSKVPSSFLQLHNDVILCADKSALSKLPISNLKKNNISIK